MTKTRTDCLNIDNPAAQSTSNQSPTSFSEIREYFKFRAEIFSLLLPSRLEFVT